MEEKTEITPAEWQVMRIIWTLGESTSTQVISLLQQKVDWKPATIKTLLRRLVEKGSLKTTRQGRGFIYTPLIKEQITMNEAADQLFSSICEMHVGATLKHVIEGVNLSQNDIDQLQTLLAKKKETAPEVVACNCVPGMKINCKRS
ncbi:CopY/TcrY family copper transport repressor [Limosilactobacillus fastidiosus]|uniref:CopY/TcrY family copper transport repressor n=1 Tax=Limosilactobacillus fastidiosus TaxID=2759855 RepID=A0A7W3TZT5_9LACO|nr:CopY/TcrY family copper transport repressor [Limosilactobacillus fastidiosus]MBB1063334.1 CopY/TcrY family copper transport repressor [Limosilactobacillus fastidiosus]MBB1086308.1 CopY/TcrY family copper transport repressor [Limosilactobacillus fastidiosus]MCD7084494.1 CopY/TcrY family copper transport repressor [Limosilactobacillus fastidiosus]MCD7086413.1 CopY/TcrY family copper transport repressor [Limosilactobacillus fastidiosus]MCD7114231.1 CopY/TcrY family copper transport repressor [